MKNFNKVAFLSIFILLIVISCDKDTIDLSYQDKDYFKIIVECTGMPRPADSYNYPVYPTMEEWAEFKTSDEMRQACEIPKKKLKSMSTQAIIQALWEYPFFYEIILRMNHLQMDFETVMDNGMYRELEKRTDASIQLLERYRVMPTICTDIISSKAFEVLLAQPVFLSQLSREEKKEVIRLALEKDSIRQSYPEHAGSSTREISWFLIGRVMQTAGYHPFVEEIDKDERLKIFLDTSALTGFYDYDEAYLMFDKILDCGKAFIK